MPKGDGNRGKGKGPAFLRAHADYKGDGCLIWPFYRDCYGYGTFKLNGKLLRANRWMCEQIHGEPPTPSHYAAHDCGNGNLGCIHPQHLFWKTPAENALDTIRHGTTRSGKRESSCKLTRAQVGEIRALKGSKTLRQISEIYGVKQRQITRIFSGYSWRVN